MNKNCIDIEKIQELDGVSRRDWFNRRYKALSVHQPYASWIAEGRKTIEFRSWYTSHRGALVICSTKRPEMPGYPGGRALCIVELIDCRPVQCLDGYAACVAYRPEYTYSWVLKYPARITPPPEVKGQQGLFGIDIRFKQ